MRQNRIFELGLVSDKGVHSADAAHRSVELVEKLVGDAVAEKLLKGEQAAGVMTLDEARDCLVVRSGH